MGVLCLDSTGCALAAMRQIASVASLKDRAAHLCRAVTAFGFPVLILMLGGIFSLNANAQERVTRYCYERCFSSLYEAEAELREKAGSYGNLWRRRETHQYMDSASGPVFMIRYTVDDHSPSVLYPPGYVISGWDSRQGICSPAIDPYNATKCANEEEAVKGMLANFRATWPACPHVEEGFEGSYAPDYASVRRTYGYGSISFSSALPGAANRKYNYTVWCPGWGNGNEPPSLRNFSLAKIQQF